MSEGTRCPSVLAKLQPRLCQQFELISNTSSSLLLLLTESKGSEACARVLLDPNALGIILGTKGCLESYSPSRLQARIRKSSALKVTPTNNMWKALTGALDEPRLRTGDQFYRATTGNSNAFMIFLCKKTARNFGVCNPIDKPIHDARDLFEVKAHTTMHTSRIRTSNCTRPPSGIHGLYVGQMTDGFHVDANVAKNTFCTLAARPTAYTS